MLQRLVHVHQENKPPVDVHLFRSVWEIWTQTVGIFGAIIIAVAASQCLLQEVACCNIAAPCPCPLKK
jgi:hypothetical protein